MTAAGERLRDFAAPAERMAFSPMRTRVVGWLKYALPLAAVVIVTVIVVWPDMHRKNSFQISFAGIAEGEDGSVGMAGGQLQGVDRKGQPYTVTAALALPDKSDPQQMRLEQPQADITTLKGAWISIRADQGQLNRLHHTLAFTGRIEIFSDSGFEVHANSATINMKAGTFASTEPVRGQGPLGLLNAMAMRGEDRGRQIYFDGPVKAVFYPAKKGRT